MNYLLKTVIFLFPIIINGQVALEIVGICEYENSILYECKDINQNKIFIVTEKSKNEISNFYERIKIGRTYLFNLEKRGVQTSGKLTLRVGGKVFWKSGDDYSKFPYFSHNVVGFYYKPNKNQER